MMMKSPSIFPKKPCVPLRSGATRRFRTGGRILLVLGLMIIIPMMMMMMMMMIHMGGSNQGGVDAAPNRRSWPARRSRPALKARWPPPDSPRRLQTSPTAAPTSICEEEAIQDAQYLFAINATSVTCGTCSDDEIDCLTTFETPICLNTSDPILANASTIPLDPDVCYTAEYVESENLQLANESLTYKYLITYTNETALKNRETWSNGTTLPLITSLFISITEDITSDESCYMTWQDQVCNGCNAACPSSTGLIGEGFAADCTNVEPYAQLPCVPDDELADGQQIMWPSVLAFFAQHHLTPLNYSNMNENGTTNYESSLSAFCSQFEASIESLQFDAVATCPTCADTAAACIGDVPEQCIKLNTDFVINTTYQPDSDTICFTSQKTATINFESEDDVAIMEQVLQVIYTQTTKNNVSSTDMNTEKIELKLYGDIRTTSNWEDKYCTFAWNDQLCDSCSLTCDSPELAYSIDCSNIAAPFLLNCITLAADDEPYILPLDIIGHFGEAKIPPSSNNTNTTSPSDDQCTLYEADLYDINPDITVANCASCTTSYVQCSGQIREQCVANNTVCYNSILTEQIFYEDIRPRQEIELAMTFSNRQGEIRVVVSGALVQGLEENCTFFWNNTKCTSCDPLCLTSDGETGFAVDCSNVAGGSAVDCVPDANDPTYVFSPTIIGVFGNAFPPQPWYTICNNITDATKEDCVCNSTAIHCSLNNSTGGCFTPLDPNAADKQICWNNTVNTDVIFAENVKVEETRYAFFQQINKSHEMVFRIETDFDTQALRGCSIMYDGNSCALCQLCPSGGYTADCSNLTPFAQTTNCSDSPNDILSLLTQGDASYSPTMSPPTRSPILSNFFTKRPTFPPRTSPPVPTNAGSPPSAPSNGAGTYDSNTGANAAVAIAVPIVVFVFLSAVVALYMFVPCGPPGRHNNNNNMDPDVLPDGASVYRGAGPETSPTLAPGDEDGEGDGSSVPVQTRAVFA